VGSKYSSLWPRVYHTCSASLRLLDRCLNLHPDVDSQYKFLAAVRIPRSLASDVAAAAIEAKDLKAAVQLLEQGTHPFDQLRRVDSSLADRLQALTTELERLSLSPGSKPLDRDTSMGLTHFEVQIALFQMSWRRCRENPS
jgi:hypothetical protein